MKNIIFIMFENYQPCVCLADEGMKGGNDIKCSPEIYLTIIFIKLFEKYTIRIHHTIFVKGRREAWFVSGKDEHLVNG